MHSVINTSVTLLNSTTNKFDEFMYLETHPAAMFFAVAIIGAAAVIGTFGNVLVSVDYLYVLV